MYTREELGLKKYGELLKILKSLGVKSGRQKTEKVIELILVAQSSQNNEESSSQSPHPECNKENECSSENKNRGSSLSKSAKESTNTPLRSPHETRNRRSTRSQLCATGCEGKMETDGVESNGESGLSSDSKTPTRSSTFVLEDDPKNLSCVSEDEALISFNRSGTFTLVSSDDDQAPIDASLVSDKEMDLLCNEVQTLDDILSVENRNQSSHQSPLKMRKSMRRSLRGQLLEAKVTEAHQNYVTTQHSSPPSLPRVEEKMCTDEGTKPQKEAEKTSLAGDKASSIPRFVSFARARKMPNFSRIHETAFKKMEALDEYVERKHSRTKSMQEKAQQELLLSDKKPENGRTLKSRNVLEPITKDKEVRKLVSFASNSKKSSSSNAVAPRSPSSFSKPVAVVGAIKRGSPSGVVSIRNLKKTPPPSAPVLAVSALPRRVKENVANELNQTNTWNKSIADPTTPGSLQRRKSYNPNVFKMGSNSRSVSKTSQDALKITKEVQKTAKTCTDDGRKPAKGHSRIAVGIASRKETFKQMAKRQPKVKSSTEVRAADKMFIRGVRTNRRFELQMANRGIQI